jgi:hypothetical protein
MIANNWMVWIIQHDRHRREGREQSAFSDDGHNTQIGNVLNLKPGT